MLIQYIDVVLNFDSRAYDIMSNSMLLRFGIGPS